MKKLAFLVPPLLVLVLLVNCTGVASPTATKAPAPGATSAAAPTATRPAAPAASTPTKEAITKGGTLQAGVESDTNVIDIITPSLSFVYPNWLVYDSLTYVDGQGKVGPELAESWDISADGLTITLKLRKSVKFQDGTDFNAAAVKFNLERLRDSKPASQVAWVVSEVNRVEVVDDYTVRLHTTSADASLLANLGHEAGMMVSPAAVAKFGDKHAQNPVGTGAFQLDSWVRDSKITLKRFDQYWNASNVHLAGIVLNIIPDNAARVTGLRTGNLDWIVQVPVLDIDNLKKDPNLVVQTAEGWSTWDLVFNNSKSPFDNKALREAVSYALDRQAMAKSLFNGLVSPAVGPITPGSWAFDTNIKGVTRDIAKAKAKLAEAGLTTGFDAKCLTYATGEYQPFCEIIQAQLKEIGGRVTVETGQTAAVLASTRQGDFQMWISRAQEYADPNTGLSASYYSKGGANRSQYSNPKFDSLVEKGRQTFKPEERKPIYSQAQQILLDDSPSAWLLTRVHVVAMNSKVKNFDVKQLPPFYNKFRLLRQTWLQK